MNYLGHRIDATGLHPKVQAINEAPTPGSVQELKSYLGILNYYGKFLPNLSTTLHPLYKLLQKDFPWTWGPEHRIAFAALKDLLTSLKFLVHFDSTQKLTLACDASDSEKPIGFASRTLSVNLRKRVCRVFFSESRSSTTTLLVIHLSL